ncbi:MAG: CDP-glycerol glycerophosphotransferase family protein [Anaerostipes sp.]|uniref:bifunctional glycosyltransferase/CDP-glycerol:glycerophosphate glycerophosphotransferase n=1 Tax=Anaerostipes sp. TaxID=1872530 RepID=UPI003994BD26
MKYDISVIIPIYNVEEFLEECLDSVLNQTKKNLEVLMVDDGSKDHSGDIAKRYSEKYENFKYLYKENGGLGNARNYAVPFATGDYIIFLDSDDIVPEDAYQKMYDKAIKYDSDMVIGRVWRFNSKKNWPSWLHERAFSDFEVKTHILQNPNLIYDTTSWNKLIKRSFYLKHQFKFPENILYEDIPVTIPMHHLANNVSMVADVCYLWRVRDGASKSITQQKDDLKNLLDRMTIMKMLDQFYREKVTDERAIFEKNFKWLFLDLKLYVNQCLFVPEDRADEIINILYEYIHDNIDQSIISRLTAIDRAKYKLILEKDREGLIRLLEYEKERYKYLHVKRKGDRYIGDFPKEIISSEDADVTEGLKRQFLKQSLHEKIENKDQCLTLKGYVYLPKVASDQENSQKLTAYLYNEQSDLKVPLEIHTVKDVHATRKDGRKINFKDRKFKHVNYNWSGYELIIDLNKLHLNEQLLGENKVIIVYERENYSKRAFLSKAVKNAKKSAQSILETVNGYQISVKFDMTDEMVIDIFKVAATVENAFEQDDQLILVTDQPVNNVYIDQMDNTIELKSCEQGLSIPVNLIKDQGILKIHSTSNEIIAFGQQKNIFLEEIDHQTEIGINLKKEFILKKEMLIKPVMEEISVSETYVDVGVRVSRLIGMPLNEGYEVALVVRDPLCEDAIVDKNQLEKKGQDFYLKYRIDFSKQDLVKNMYAGARRFELLIKKESEVHYFEIATAIQFYKFVYTTKQRKFILRNQNGYLAFASKKTWPTSQATKQRRDLLFNTFYPVFRKLPIKKKYVMFESMWGDKFSCNPRHIYEYMQKFYPEYTCIWSLKDECIPISGNGIRVRRLSLKYYYYMAVCKYLVNNANFDNDYLKRKEQVEVQTMHGTPLKTLGVDVPGELTTKKSYNDFINRCKRWDFLVVQSKRAGDIVSKCYPVNTPLLNSGYPRTDMLFTKNNEQDINMLKEKMGIPTNKKVILYAPTWRIRNKFELMLDIEKMKRALGEDYVLLLRLHYFAAAGFEMPQSGEGFLYDFTNYECIEEMYLVSDIMITDYSSVMFDYSILNRPILFYVYDLEEYRDNLRGFNLDLEKEAPGPLIKTSDDLIEALKNINHISKEYDGALKAFRESFNGYECENSAQKVVEAMLGKK